MFLFPLREQCKSDDKEADTRPAGRAGLGTAGSRPHCGHPSLDSRPMPPCRRAGPELPNVLIFPRTAENMDFYERDLLIKNWKIALFLKPQSSLNKAQL